MPRFRSEATARGGLVTRRELSTVLAEKRDVLPQVDYLPIPRRIEAQSNVPCAPLLLSEPYVPLTKWAIVADNDIPENLAWYCWDLTTKLLASDWYAQLQQYTNALAPTWAGYTEIERGQFIPVDTDCATLYLTTQTPQGFLTSWAAYHTSDVNGYPYAFVPTYAYDHNVWTWIDKLARVTIPFTHELAEMLTDPLPGNGGWRAADGSENADECNWRPYAIQGYEASQYGSNRTGMCAP